MRLALVVVVSLASGCSAASSSDAGTILHTCSDAVTATSTVSCFTECTTEVACDFTDGCHRPGCPVTTVGCTSGRVSIYVSGILCDMGPPSLDAGAHDAGTDSADAVTAVVHTCDEARGMLASLDCRFGCDAGGTPCDFTSRCCIAPSVFVACEGGRVVTTELGGDAGPCDFDASLAHDGGG